MDVSDGDEWEAPGRSIAARDLSAGDRFVAGISRGSLSAAASAAECPEESGEDGRTR
jgi:hypothetical protein